MMFKRTLKIFLLVSLLTIAMGRDARLGFADAHPDTPNIIFILVDDLDYRAMPYLTGLKRTLQDEGVTFENFFTPHAVCCPSRASIFRGQYAHNHRVLGVKNGPESGWQSFRDRGHESSTIATWLQDAGYATGLYGKYLNGYPFPWADWHTYVPPGWDEWHVGIHNQYQGFNVTFNENGTNVSYGDTEAEYFTDLLKEKALDFIDHVDGPYFLMITPTAPHVPSTPAPRHEGAFATAVMPQSPNFNEDDITDKPAWIQENYPPLTPDEIAIMEDEFRRILESMLAVEEMVEAIIDKLRQVGQLDHTYIVFTSDHGYHHGSHRLKGPKWLGAKRTFYEEDIRIPLIMRGPGVPRGVRLDHFVMNHDLAPTFADLGGATIPGFVDGRSIVSLLSGGAMDHWRDRFLLEHWNKESPHGLPNAVGVRTSEYKYVEIETGETELYDLQRDPYELENLSGEPDYSPILSSLARDVAVLRMCSAQSCRTGEGMGSVEAR